MSKKRRKRKNGRILLITIIIIFIGCFWLLNNKTLIKKDSKKDYTIESRDSELMKKEFNILKENYYSDNIDYEKYAKSIGKLFIIDLYTIKNKNNKYDVGSVEYVHPDIRSNFKLSVGDTLYKYLEEKNYRKTKYPEVKSIEITNFSEDTFMYNNIEYNAYVVSLKWDYVKDLGYDKKGIISIIKEDKKLYVVKYEAVA
ncbi:MAG: hypothetical protein GX951_03155 [Mollicutes bacterium]|nr:hypothetical protein [Mollicutes bacterium]